MGLIRRVHWFESPRAATVAVVHLLGKVTTSASVVVIGYCEFNSVSSKGVFSTVQWVRVFKPYIHARLYAHVYTCIRAHI